MSSWAKTSEQPSTFHHVREAPGKSPGASSTSSSGRGRYPRLMPSQAVEAFRARLASAALFLDFDGTLSEIVARPEDARPMPEVPDILARVGSRCRLLAIVSGRSARQLVDWLGPDIEIWGVHGAEVARDGKIELAEGAATFIGVMSEVRAELQERLLSMELPGVLLEDKGVVVNVHYRTAPDPGAAERTLAPVVEAIAARSGLEVGRGRMTLEVRPRGRFSKAAVVRERARAEAVGATAFIGDDVVDLPAFDALDALAAEGMATLKVAVRSHESPDALLERADLVVDGPAGVVTFLESLL